MKQLEQEGEKMDEPAPIIKKPLKSTSSNLKKTAVSSKTASKTSTKTNNEEEEEKKRQRKEQELKRRQEMKEMMDKMKKEVKSNDGISIEVTENGKITTTQQDTDEKSAPTSSNPPASSSSPLLPPHTETAEKTPENLHPSTPENLQPSAPENAPKPATPTKPLSGGQIGNETASWAEFMKQLEQEGEKTEEPVQVAKKPPKPAPSNLKKTAAVSSKTAPATKTASNEEEEKKKQRKEQEMKRRQEMKEMMDKMKKEVKSGDEISVQVVGGEKVEGAKLSGAPENKNFQPQDPKEEKPNPKADSIPNPGSNEGSKVATKLSGWDFRVPRK